MALSCIEKVVKGLTGVRSRAIPQARYVNTTSFDKPYRVYRTRWLVLSVCCLLALSNAMLWISFTTVAEEVDEFYCHGSECRASYISNQIFQLVAVIFGIGGMYVTDNYGIRLSIMCGTTLNFFGSLIRMVSSIPWIDDSTLRVVLLHTGTTIAATTQIFYLVLPPKVAEIWFPGDQRSLANALSFIANPLGVVLGTLTPSLFFNGSNHLDRATWRIFSFNAVMALLTAVTFFLSFFVRQGSPPTPPSASSAKHSIGAPPFWKSIMMCIRNKQFLIQMITFGLAFSELWGFMVIMHDITTEQGYSLYGYPMSLAAVAGVVGALICGVIADYTKKFKEIARVCWVCFTSTVIFTRFWLRRKWSGAGDSVILMLACAGLGAFSIPQMVIGAEMGVETTFPIYEATSSGLLMLSGQLWMFATYFVFETAKRFELFYEFHEMSIAGNWQLNLDIWCVLAILAVVLSVIVNPRYKRLMLEDSMAKQRIPPNSTLEMTRDVEHAKHEVTMDKPHLSHGRENG
ncbi:hypothetical protein KIN20_003463 [Parelaphostrongylus tenuis]|uniref:Major facilitator superfamily (MFS) profile domain-containing protein n=1 Tax=Parelaphostrongylus tenuis TaxID=148309 RepID=A0AAD5LXB7_PARTN|nr:hypothetical protein KIN20_003463 [Parelaphostrongylus tenuis]